MYSVHTCISLSMHTSMCIYIYTYTYIYTQKRGVGFWSPIGDSPFGSRAPSTIPVINIQEGTSKGI